jgi:NAD+ synthetase
MARYPAAVAFAEQWLVVEYDASPAVHAAGVVDDGDESVDALAWRAVTRGVQDYCRKNGFGKAWVGLSGGIDSALVLAIAVDALGAGNVSGAPAVALHLGPVQRPGRRAVRSARREAGDGADRAGIRRFPRRARPDVRRHRPDVTEENLQSRCRGAILMALANKFGGLLLTTGNKSEYAVGYATIYGDMCGGYAPLKDLYKTEVFALSVAQHRRRRTGDPAGGDRRPPSAELRENQKDQDSLPPYDVLDAILLRHVDQEQSRDEIVAAGLPPTPWTGAGAGARQRVEAPSGCAWAEGVAARVRRERRYPITNGYRG